MFPSEDLNLLILSLQFVIYQILLLQTLFFKAEMLHRSFRFFHCFELVQLHPKSSLLFMLMIIYYRGSKMMDLQSADSGLDKVWPNIDAVLNALLAFHITTLCPMLLLFSVGCWFKCIPRIFYTCRCSISCTSECFTSQPCLVKKPSFG